MIIYQHHATIARAVERAYNHPQYEAGNIEFRIEHDVIAVAGTNEWRDWVTNLRQFPWYARGIGWVPAGYLKVARLVHAELLTQAYKQEIDLSDKYLGGHSAGGAVAVLVGAILARSNIFVREVVTYGAPDVGRVKVLTQSVPTTQIVDGNDMVPKATFYPRAVPRAHVGHWRGFDHPISVYAEDIEAMFRDGITTAYS